MPKFSVDFKLKVIEAYKNHEPLPKVEGTKEVSMVRNAQDWTLLYKTKGIEGISNDTIFRNYTLKDKVKTKMRLICCQSLLIYIDVFNNIESFE